MLSDNDDAVNDVDDNEDGNDEEEVPDAIGTAHAHAVPLRIASQKKYNNSSLGGK
jgi:hypothetical protein